MAKSGFHVKEFAWELQELMGIPREVFYTPNGNRYEKPTAATKTIQAILKVISDALHPDEKVNIPGFGTFQVVTRPAMKRRVILDTSKEGKILAHVDQAIEFPAKRRVTFKPSIHLEAMMNEENPSWMQRRAMRTWK